MSGESLSSVRQLFQAVCNAVPGTKKGYVELTRYFPNDVQADYWRAEATTKRLAERTAN